MQKRLFSRLCAPFASPPSSRLGSARRLPRGVFTVRGRLSFGEQTVYFMKYLEDWMTEHKVDEVECLVPDINGIPRGKILPSRKFIKSSKGESLRLPSSVFLQTVTGEYPDVDEDSIGSYEDPDVYLTPDAD